MKKPKNNNFYSVMYVKVMSPKVSYLSLIRLEGFHGSLARILWLLRGKMSLLLK